MEIVSLKMFFENGLKDKYSSLVLKFEKYIAI
jgi:hypothetical protein